MSSLISGNTYWVNALKNLHYFLNRYFPVNEKPMYWQQQPLFLKFFANMIFPYQVGQSNHDKLFLKQRLCLSNLKYISYGLLYCIFMLSNTNSGVLLITLNSSELQKEFSPWQPKSKQGPQKTHFLLSEYKP